MRREDVSVNLNGMLESVIVGSLTVSDIISVVVCGQKGRSWRERKVGARREREEREGGGGRKEEGMKRVYKRYNKSIYRLWRDGDNIGVLQSLFKE